MSDVGKIISIVKSLGVADPDVIREQTSDWLDDHPEATTTVQDGAISRSKLDADLKEKTDEVGVLKSAITQSEVEDLLLRDEIPGTSTTVTIDSNGNPTSIVHSADGTTVRTDAFVWSTGSVTETRTASDKYITITTNLETLAQTISAVREVA